MRITLIFIICLFTLTVSAQDTKPVGANFKQITTTAWGYNINDSIPWLYKGATYGWTKLATNRQLQHVIDSVNGVKGSGTAGYLPIWLTVDSLGNSPVIVDDYNNVSIGLSLFPAGLTVSSDNPPLQLQNAVGSRSLTSDNNFGFEIGDIDQMYSFGTKISIDPSNSQINLLSAKVGINKLLPSQALEVNGKVKIDTIPIIINPTYVLSDSSGIVSKTIIGKYFEYEITVNAENNIATPFTLTSNTAVYYNGSAIKNTLWSGEGTTTLNLSLLTYKYDQIILKQ